MADESQPYPSLTSIAGTNVLGGPSATGSRSVNDSLAVLGREASADSMKVSPPQEEPAPPTLDSTAASAQPHAKPASPSFQELASQQPSSLRETAQPSTHEDGRGWAQAVDQILGSENRHADPAAAESLGYKMAKDEYLDELPLRRRGAVMMVATTFGLIVLGASGAFGYRALFGSGSEILPFIQGSKPPLKVVLDNPGAQGGKPITEQVTEISEKVVPREQRSPGVNQLAQAGPPNAGPQSAAPLAPATAAVVASAAVVMASPTPAQASALPQAAPQTAPAAASAQANPTPAPLQAAAPTGAPLPVNSDRAPARARSPVQTANAAPTASAQVSAPAGRVRAYAVQIASQKSEADARAAYQTTTRKFPSILQGKNMFVYSINLGVKGTYYRAMVGPYSAASEASQVCSSLKSAGGSCIVRSNP